MLRPMRMFGGILAGLMLAVGCSSSSGTAPTVPVRGKITYRGQALAGVNVVFTPTSGRPATGLTDANGDYVLSTFRQGDGAVPGTHTVTITPGGQTPMPGTPEAAQAATQPSFPAKYSNPALSGLKAEVKAGAGPFNFDLVD